MSNAFTLAYPVQSVTWDGEKIRRRPAAEISQSLELMQQCGVNEVMLSGYHVEEESDFDVDAETRRLGAELEQRGMRAAQHHGLSATFGPLASSGNVPWHTLACPLVTSPWWETIRTTISRCRRALASPPSSWSTGLKSPRSNAGTPRTW